MLDITRVLNKYNTEEVKTIVEEYKNLLALGFCDEPKTEEEFEKFCEETLK